MSAGGSRRGIAVEAAGITGTTGEMDCAGADWTGIDCRGAYCKGACCEGASCGNAGCGGEATCGDGDWGGAPGDPPCANAASITRRRYASVAWNCPITKGHKLGSVCRRSSMSRSRAWGSIVPSSRSSAMIFCMVSAFGGSLVGGFAASPVCAFAAAAAAAAGDVEAASFVAGGFSAAA